MWNGRQFQSITGAKKVFLENKSNEKLSVKIQLHEITNTKEKLGNN
jgi:hypothetical protein